MTLSQLETLVLARLGDDGTYYPGVVAAINEGQRLHCLLTLALEETETVPIAAASPFSNILPQLPRFVLSRRIYNSSGQQLRPSTLAELQALDSDWQMTPGAPLRYVVTGLDFLAIYPQPAADDTLTVVHVTAPATLINAGDMPQIRPTSHWALASYAAWAVRQVEGGQEFAKFQKYFQEFMADAQEVAELVRKRSRDAGFEVMPAELGRTKG